MIFSVDWDSLRLLLDSANASTIDDGELDVALITPGGVPRVLDEPVFFARGGVVAIANNKDSMIHGGATGSGVKDSRSVWLEDILVSLKRDCERLLLDSCLHLGDVVRGNVALRSDTLSSLGRVIVLAGIVLAIVGVVGVDAAKFSVIVDPVLEGPILPATSAAIALSHAGDKLLLRESLKLASLEVISTF